jgi:hypothetical protein
MKLYNGRAIDYDNAEDRKNMDNIWKANIQMLEECDDIAKKEGTLLGRILSEPVADGQAHYQIIKVNKKTVRISHCDGIYDDYYVSYWGGEATIDKAYAEQVLRFKDEMSKIFPRIEVKEPA